MKKHEEFTTNDASVVDITDFPNIDKLKVGLPGYTSHGSNHYFAEGFYYTYDRGTPEFVFTCPHCKKDTRYNIDINRLKD